MFLVLFLKFLVVVFVGTCFFIAYDAEWDKQRDASKLYEDENAPFSVIDAMFFSVVVSTTVGYGHRITPITDEAKVFMIFYMLVATTTVGMIIDGIADIYIEEIAGESVVKDIVKSTVWVHKSDIDQDGRVDEADYCLFKLQQMMKVDVDILGRLERRFDELDIGDVGRLKLGVEVPNADQVQRLQETDEFKKGELGLPELWQERRSDLCRELV